jgi:hypothetical protein
LWVGGKDLKLVFLPLLGRKKKPKRAYGITVLNVRRLLQVKNMPKVIGFAKVAITMSESVL